MAAENPIRRNMTARELGVRFGKSPRTIRRVVAEPRTEYEARTAARHQKIYELREAGMSYRKIATQTGITVGAVQYALNKLSRS